VLAVGGLTFAVGIGLRGGQRWAWWFAQANFAISAFAAFVGLLMVIFARGEASLFLPPAAGLTAIYTVFFACLCTRAVKDHFGLQS
jgi:hypothetical protein